MNFNTDAQLFLNLREVIISEDPCLQNPIHVIDGHVVHKGDVIARFDNDDHASALLTEAGFIKVEMPRWKLSFATQKPSLP